MKRYVDLNRLKESLKAFYEVTHLKVTIYDSDQEVIIEYPLKNQPICMALQKNEEYCQMCVKSNIEGFNKATTENRNNIYNPYIYKCYAGLTEVIVPLEQDSEIIGYVMFGQITTDSSKESVLSAIDNLNSDIDKEELKSLIKSVHYHSEELLNSEALLLGIFSKFFTQDKLVVKRNDELYEEAISYINHNVLSDFTIDDLSHHLAVSRSYLYDLFKKKGKETIAQYIRNTRLEKSRTLLLESSKSIGEIADTVRLGDANAFIKLFKNKYGVTPKKYRNEKTTEN